ncbi:hypothetical protein BLDA23_15695 [Bacillus licheniformis]|nr:hypothetical protein BLDA23_15695 [Bacillus licheniformis]
MHHKIKRTTRQLQLKKRQKQMIGLLRIYLKPRIQSSKKLFLNTIKKIDDLNWKDTRPQKIKLTDIGEPIKEGNGDYTRELISEKDNSDTAIYTVRAINEEDGTFKGVRVFTSSDNGKASPKGMGSMMTFLLISDSSIDDLTNFLNSSETEKDLSNDNYDINISIDSSLNAFTLKINPK